MTSLTETLSFPEPSFLAMGIYYDLIPLSAFPDSIR
jgi:hypothetical protein